MKAKVIVRHLHKLLIFPDNKHTGKCIRRIWWYLRVLPILHIPEVVDIGVNTI